MRIRVIAPVTAEASLTTYPAICAPKARPDTHISIVRLDRGPASLECMYEDAVAAPGVVQRAIEAERAGADAVVIDCMNDPGLEAARESVSIPVVGAAQSAMLLASMMAHTFSIMGTAPRDVYPSEELVRRYGLWDTYASTRWVDIPVLSLRDSRERLFGALIEEATKAIVHDGAHAIVFGCTMMRGMGESLRARLKEKGLDAAVIDPSFAALKWAEMLVDLGLSQSRLCYGPTAGEKGSAIPAATQDPPQTAGGVRKFPRLGVVAPVTRDDRSRRWLDAVERGFGVGAREGCELRVAPIDAGPSALGSFAEEALALPSVLRLARAMEREGADALIVGSALDPGLDALRESADIPVVGPGQASLFLAASLCRRFSILANGMTAKRRWASKIAECGVACRVASIRDTGLSAEAAAGDPDAALGALTRAAEAAVLGDDAQALVLGDTGMSGLAARLGEALAAKGMAAPIVDPAAAAVKLAEALVDLGLAQSKITYPRPPKKALAGYADLEV